MEYELIRHGLRLRWLGTDRLTWRDLHAIVTYAPPESALAREVNPQAAMWGLPEQLMALIADALRVANWQRAGKGDRPKPLPRPGVDDGAEQSRIGGNRVMTLDQAREWRDKRRGR